MNIDESDFTFVENLLLRNTTFNDQQKEFIRMFESKTIIAVPGAGKTTSLAAKIILLLKKLRETGSRDGVCVITYTNVAVKEINEILITAGLGTLSHPHFIGTIHEFFNTFCVLPYFKMNLKSNELFFSEDDENGSLFYEKFIASRRPFLMDKKGVLRNIAKRIINSNLIVDDQYHYQLENTSNWEEEKFLKYKNDMLAAKIERKEKGYLLYDDTFWFSKKFLSDPYCVKMIRNRFKYIFIDEYQDTSSIGIKLIYSLFNTQFNILQLIGDPYQTIYLKSGQLSFNTDNQFRLNLTNRFGKEIAQQLNIIIPDAKIEVNTERKSFKPVFLVYSELSEVYRAYKEIIKEHEGHSVEFKHSKNIDKVLVRYKKWTQILLEGSNYVNDHRVKMKTKTQQLKMIIIDFFCRRIVPGTKNVTEIKRWINKHEKVRELNSILLSFLKSGTSVEAKNNLRNWINERLKERELSSININNSLFTLIDVELTIKDNLENINTNPSSDFYTIHSVKGETLRSALIVNLKDGYLTDILLHKNNLITDANYNDTEVHLLYVAMSRVTHLLVYAVHETEYMEKVHGKLSDWEIRWAGTQSL
ncbi:UvrD-helicase domain-containing protein [Paenibacillus peoriae]|uniref:UvrD-helicase domain-containing protein n=1 Tax=Paenibacillus peoriae TaxID=59893 RepID=UPI00096E86EF|nr:UvrD-helicase domain-containing protein [Paenibacillus peoriae]OMF43420.1 hypothetical protein BK135_17270 [Paenibacillus peoriae]